MNSTIRRKLGIKASIIGIITNLVLFFIKFAVGTLSGSVAVTADSFNNLSDMGSCFVTLMGFKLSGKPADDKYPFGYGRFEYISALVVSIIILVLGVELIKTSVEKIFSPEKILFDFVMIAVLILTIPAKLFLNHVYTSIGKKINSTVMTAASRDSINDVIVTSVTVLCALTAKFTGIEIDGYAGLFVAVYVIFSGIGILRDTMGPLLGQKPERSISEEIERRIKSYSDIIDIHDMIVHNYGPNKYIASVHAEVPANTNIIKIHDIIDLAEREILNDMGIITTIHLDPIETEDEKTADLRKLVTGIITNINCELSMHDFRVVCGETHTNLIFDVIIPVKFNLSEAELKAEIDSQIQKEYPNYYTVIIFDKTYI